MTNIKVYIYREPEEPQYTLVTIDTVGNNSKVSETIRNRILNFCSDNNLNVKIYNTNHIYKKYVIDSPRNEIKETIVKFAKYFDLVVSVINDFYNDIEYDVNYED